jgi:undecaprenyl-diphosphatase
MLEFLASLDRSLFLYINVHLANPVTDLVMPVVTSDLLLRILFVVAFMLMMWKGDRRLRWLALFSLVTLVLSDVIASHLLKPWFGRIRPCHTLSDIHLLVNCGAGLSMPSNHATNAFGQAALFALAYPRFRWWLIGFASVVAMSRVFVGVHYPSDVLVGSCLGVLIGGAVYLALKRVKVLGSKNTPQQLPGG